MSTYAPDFETPVPTALDIMEAFSNPPADTSKEQEDERTRFVLHFWPDVFPVHDLKIGIPVLPPGVVIPVYSRFYQTRHLGDGGSSLDVPTPVRLARNYAGRAVNIPMAERFGPYGLVALDDFTKAGESAWPWERIKAWWGGVLPGGFEHSGLPVFDRYTELVALLKRAAKGGEWGAVERAALAKAIGSAEKAKLELRSWATRRLSEARKAERSGVGFVELTDDEYTRLMYAGKRVPKFLAEKSERDDLVTTDELPEVLDDDAPGSAAAEAIKQSLALQAQMAEAFMAVLQAQKGPAPADDGRVADLEARLAAETAAREEMAASAATTNQMMAEMLAQMTELRKGNGNRHAR